MGNERCECECECYEEELVEKEWMVEYGVKGEGDVLDECLEVKIGGDVDDGVVEIGVVVVFLDVGEDGIGVVGVVVIGCVDCCLIVDMVG